MGWRSLPPGGRAGRPGVGRCGWAVSSGNDGRTGRRRHRGNPCIKPSDPLDLGELASFRLSGPNENPVNRPLDAPAPPADPIGDRTGRWLVVAACLVLFPIAMLLADDRGLWLPALGVGIAILSWTFWVLLPLLFVEAIVCRLPFSADSRAALLESVLLTAQIGLSWWIYHHLAQGSRWIEDPLSGMLFLVLIPGVVAAGFAIALAVLTDVEQGEPLGPLFGRLWLNRILGALVPLPALLVMVTPVLVRRRLIDVPPPLA